MPLYPLEEDIRPGDVFLTTNSIDSEIDSWNRQGFLPLVNRYARIPIESYRYTDFYANTSDKTDPPSFTRQPKTAFPSYTFKVDKRGALGLAIPLSSVPVALSVSGARRATGSVVLGGASTQGLPDMQMHEIIIEWASDKEVKMALKRKADMARWLQKGTSRYNPLILRVVTRVFSVSNANVSLSFQQASGFGVQAGSPPDTPELLGTSEEDYQKRITELNQTIELQQELNEAEPVEMPVDSLSVTTDSKISSLKAELQAVKQLQAMNQIQALRRNLERKAMINEFGGFILPGGAGRITGLTARGITMKETFEKPLVVGYWASEYLVLGDGSIVQIGDLNNLLNNPDEYRRKADLTEKFMHYTPEHEPTNATGDPTTDFQ